MSGARGTTGARALLLGTCVGALAGCGSALADFGAHVLWLESVSDRAGLLLRLIGLQVPIGALCGLVLALAAAASEPLWQRATANLSDARTRELRLDALRGLSWALLCAPGLVAVSILLFTGGSAKTLPAVPVLQALTALVLIASAASAAFAAQRTHRSLTSARARRAAALLCGVAGFALSKLDQHVLPGHYAYLHALLTALAFLAFAACALLALQSAPWASVAFTRLPAPASLAAILLGCTAVLVTSVLTLDANQNVRVALMHPNAPHSRSVMLALGPLVLEPLQARALADARKRAQKHRGRDRPARAADGPVHEGAHVLLVTVDALRADHLGTYGYERETSPEIDALAAKSIVFERAYAQAPHSSYSLCSLLTSSYLHETLDLGQPPPEATLANVLAEAGYHTAAFYTLGVFHTQGERLARYKADSFGFALHEHANREAEELTDRVLEEIDRTVARGEPSAFLWAHYFDVHEPYQDTRFGSSDLDRYDGEIRKTDAAVGRLIREARKKLSREVIVLLTADHGEEFREHGGVYHGSTLYEEQVRVPLIMQASALPPRRVPAPVELVAVAPTVLGLLNIAAPASMRGADLRPLALGKVDNVGPAFSAVIHKKMAVEPPYKLIADLRFGLYELYNLEQDPHERENLADAEPEKLDALRGHIYRWLDELSESPSENEAEVALARGRVRDRRAVGPLVKLAKDTSALEEHREEALRLLGFLADDSSRLALVALLEDPSLGVAGEAAVALGRMFDARATETLRRLVSAEDPDLRMRAAVSLGRLRDEAAVPALIEALWLAPSDYEREEAVRWLGRLRDLRALEPLLQILPERRTRHLAVVALGRLGDPRAYEPLLDVLGWEKHNDVRAATVEGLGHLGDERAIPTLVELAAREPLMGRASESLIRLGALQKGAIGGADLSPKLRGAHGLSRCHEGSVTHDWDYLHRTSCDTRERLARVRLSVPESVASAPHGVTVLLSARRIDKGTPTELRLSIGRQALGSVRVDGSWAEHALELPAASLREGSVEARFEAGEPRARFTLDHLLLIPRHAPLVARSP